MASADARNELTPGTPVEVLCRFDGEWVSGFVVESVHADGGPVLVAVRRGGEGGSLPESFPTTEVRPLPGAR